jgi:hypothetical protein
MFNNRIIGLVLVVVGVCFFYFGNQASEGLSDQIHKAFTGNFSDSTVWYFIVGGASAVVGIALALRAS